MKKKSTDWVAVQRKTSEAVHTEQIHDRDALIKQQAERIAFVEKELDIALSLKDAKLSVASIAKSLPEKSEATAFAIAGDWHVEETVEAKTVNGLNEYNLEIADQRITKFFRSILRLVEIERAGTEIENLVVVILGDMMTGYIHEELQENNGLSPTETVLWLRKRILAGLKLLQKEGGFKRIIVPCSYGNHGRTTKKPRHATGAKNSYEWMMYHVMRDDLPSVEWQIADGYFNLITVYDRLFAIHHGDNVRYEGGIGGLTIPAEKAIASWAKSIPAYLHIFGHHHTAQQTQRWLCNGSLIGYGPYSLSIKAGFEPPQQTFFLLDSKRGRTGTWPILF